ncbi:hypothetical protein PUV54_06930 [Hyphococcus flavus]|uniref:Uncharacterized protein n=1 Tax=Hyphococcus flavus TaxID=1866326 RepID=A0AAE9ZDR6_9PROT|nr:hypothetical protein [Hyphococcus flavus]WDI32929.1 hypothetical protein PUV54_06930 [Hyphococcus flavus]
MLKKVAFSVLGAGFVMMSAPAFAGEWKLNARACPDLVEDRLDRIEDRRDRRFTTSRRDRREDRYDRRENRRDEAVTVCPARAFYYQPDRRELKRAARYDERRGRSYGKNQRSFRSELRWDRRMRMNYIRIDGRKIYVRG